MSAAGLEATTADSGLELAVQERPDLIVLDIPPEPLYVDGWPQR
jgi:DNA-binding response OmpR family regulator